VNLHISAISQISQTHFVNLQSKLVRPKTGFHTCEQLVWKRDTHLLWGSCCFSSRPQATRAGGSIQMPGSVKSDLVQDNYTGLRKSVVLGRDGSSTLALSAICSSKRYS